MLGGWRNGLKMSALVVLGLPGATSGCQGDYPIAPTACDEWCNASIEGDCFDYDPAACVASCERQGLTSNPDCAN